MPIVYLTTNIINDKKYIGVDSLNNPNYLGSGKLLKKAILKYGRDSFKKEILFEFENLSDAYKKEAELITTYNAIDSEDYYNIHPGGKGGWGHLDTKGINNPMYGKSVRDVLIEKYGKREGIEIWEKSRINAGKAISKKLKGKKLSETHKNNLSKSRKEFWDKLSEEEKDLRRSEMSKNMKAANITRSDEYKKKMSESLKLKSSEIHRKVECKYCGKKMNMSNLKRWHDEKCKHKNGID